LRSALLMILFLLGTEPAFAWTLTSSLSPDGGEERVILIQKAETPVARRFGGLTRPELTIQCVRDRISFSINYGFHLSVDELEVMTRLDEEPVQHSRWSSGSNHGSIGPLRRETSLAFIRALIGKKKLEVRLTPYRQESISTTFNLTGLEEEIGEVAEACGWSIQGRVWARRPSEEA